MQQVQPPMIPIVGEWIRRNPGTVSLGQGIVSYGPPPEVRAQIDGFLSKPKVHRYHTVSGIPSLREVIVDKLKQDNGIDLNREQSDSALCVTAGGNMAFVNAVLAITDPDDQIIILRPFYFNHEMAIGIAGCQAIVVDTDETYQPVVERIRDNITDKTRAVVTISPNNPTGVVYPEAVLREINSLCAERGLYHIHDEAYEYFTYEGAEHFSPGSMPGSANHTISLFSLSKAYGFASWRIGYMVFPSGLEQSIKKIQDTVLICPPVISQVAAVAALQAGRGYCQMHLQKIEDARTVVSQELARVQHLCEVPSAQGAFYFLLKVHTSRSGMELTESLIRNFGVAVLPGETFGLTEGCYLRISYGPLDGATAQEGLGRLVRGLQSLIGASTA